MTWATMRTRTTRLCTAVVKRGLLRRLAVASGVGSGRGVQAVCRPASYGRTQIARHRLDPSTCAISFYSRHHYHHECTTHTHTHTHTHIHSPLSNHPNTHFRRTQSRLARNRITARLRRERKKNLTEELTQQVTNLKVEIKALEMKLAMLSPSAQSAAQAQLRAFPRPRCPCRFCDVTTESESELLAHLESAHRAELSSRRAQEAMLRNELGPDDMDDADPPAAAFGGSGANAKGRGAAPRVASAILTLSQPTSSQRMSAGSED